MTDCSIQVDNLISLFNDTFYDAYNTKLIRGKDEPIYLPRSEASEFHQVVFAHGYFSSALHEIAHWCIAGDARRLLEDYGYWYCPDGRDEQQQKAFESVEIKPQALEWIFSVAANKKFQVSTDNLNGAEPDRKGFQKAVFEQVAIYLRDGLPNRAQAFTEALIAFYKTGPMHLGLFQLEQEHVEAI